MNMEAVRRSPKHLALFMVKLVNSVLLLPWSLPSEAEHQSEYALSCSLAVEPNSNSLPRQTLLTLPTSNQTRRNRRNSFDPRIPVSYVVFFNNVNIFNFPQESFSPNLIFAALLPILLNYLQIQSSRTSMASVTCSILYYLALAAKFLFPCLASPFEALMTMFGSLAVATLMSLALHLPWWSVFFILLFTGGLFKLLNKHHVTYYSIGQPRTMHPVLPLHNVIFNH